MPWFQEFLSALAAGGVLAGFAAKFLQWVEDKWPWLQNTEPWVRQLLAWVVACVLSWVPYLAQVVMLYEPMPADWRAWAEVLAALAAVGLTANQFVHVLTKPKN